MRRIILATTAVLFMACGPSRTDTMKTLAEEQAISAQKDSLLKEVSQTSSFISDVSLQLGTVRNLKAGRPAARKGDLEESMTPAEHRAQILAQVKEITERLNETDRRLAASRRKVTELTGSDASKSKRLAAFDSAVASFRTIIETQRTQIADLSAQVQALTEENTMLKSDNVRLVSATTQLTTERDSIAAEQNTVYYVAGTRDALAKRHIIENVGGFLGLGKTQVPARVLDPTAFTPIDLRTVSEIALPRPGHAYKVLTRQNLSALATLPDKKGRLSDTIRIREPQSFWAGSKFLILVEM
ncbi:MAG: Cbp1 family collagen-binding glycoprotein adhesin [Gemmatimonadaceae bacterium]